jgi:hypothetical protein
MNQRVEKVIRQENIGAVYVNPDVFGVELSSWFTASTR